MWPSGKHSGSRPSRTPPPGRQAPIASPGSGQSAFCREARGPATISTPSCSSSASTMREENCGNSSYRLDGTSADSRFSVTNYRNTIAHACERVFLSFYFHRSKEAARSNQLLSQPSASKDFERSVHLQMSIQARTPISCLHPRHENLWCQGTQPRPRRYRSGYEY
jgi:hypothetical protein